MRINPIVWLEEHEFVRVMFTMKSSPECFTKQITVLIADDHPVVRQGLAAILDSQPDIKVVAEAANGEEASKLYNQIQPDVLVLDLRMPKKSGLQVTAELASQRGLNPGIVVMTSFDGEEDIRQVLSAGAKAFLVKGSEPDEIREAVRSVARGERYLPANIGLKLADSVSRPELSRRETEVLQYLARGRSNKEIGQYLCVSEGTVKHHVKSILGKLGAIGRTEASAIAARRGLVHLV